MSVSLGCGFSNGRVFVCAVCASVVTVVVVVVAVGVVDTGENREPTN